MKIWRLFILFIILLTGNNVWSQYPGNIRLSIKDRLTASPITGSRIKVIVNKDTLYISTDTEGAYIFRDLQAGPYIISILHDGYMLYEVKNIMVGEGKTAYLTMELIPNRKLTRKERKQLGK